jgi:hypothetical protein
MKRIRGLSAYTDDRALLERVNTFVWTWGNVASFIDSL